MPETHLRYRACGECEVTWHRSQGDECWSCGDIGKPSTGPAIGNQSGFGNAFTDDQWARVRDEVLTGR